MTPVSRSFIIVVVLLAVALATSNALANKTKARFAFGEECGFGGPVRGSQRVPSTKWIVEKAHPAFKGRITSRLYPTRKGRGADLLRRNRAFFIEMAGLPPGDYEIKFARTIPSDPDAPRFVQEYTLAVEKTLESSPSP